MKTETSLVRLPARAAESGLVQVIVETPKGSRNKFKYDERLGVFTLHKALPLGFSFPFDFGFIPSTRGDDGDPLDILVLLDESAPLGCLVPTRLIGVLEAEQTGEGETVRNDRLIGMLETPFNQPQVHSLKDLSSAVLTELEHFFVSYNQLEGRQFKPLGRHGPRRAAELLEEGIHRFEKAKR